MPIDRDKTNGGRSRLHNPPEPPSRTATVIRIADSIKSRSKHRRLIKAVRAATEAALEQANPGANFAFTRRATGVQSRKRPSPRPQFRARAWTTSGTRAVAGTARTAAGAARSALTARTAWVAQAVQAKFGATTRGATQSDDEVRQEVRFVRTGDPGGNARFVCTSDMNSLAYDPFRKDAEGGTTPRGQTRPRAQGRPRTRAQARAGHGRARSGSKARANSASAAAAEMADAVNRVVARLLKRLTAPLERFEMERPTKVILALTGIFTALICVPAASAWATHRTSPDLVGHWINSVDAQTNVSVYRVGSGTVSHVPLNNYIVNVLAAELPPDAPMQSLEAAAVATRTYIVYLITHQSTGITSIAAQHGALVTDDALLDLPWLTDAQQAQKYGANTATFTARLQEAVIATDGEVLTYQGSPIPAFMFALSPGRTRNASAVFGRNMPYLPSIACPDDQVDPASTRTISFTRAQLSSRLALSSGSAPAGGATTASGATASGSSGTASGNTASGNTASGNTASGSSATARINPAAFTVSSRGSDGFVQTVNMKGNVRAWTGIDFANRLGLPSADFTLAVQGGDLVVTTKGVGTDIGMSLHEATVLAAQGDSWQAIVSHFYPGTTAVPDLLFVTSHS